MSTESEKAKAEGHAPPSVSTDQFEKLAEVLARSQSNYRELIDNLDQALFTLSLSGEVKVANLRLAEILGVSFSDLIGHSLSEFVESPTWAQTQAALPAFLKQGKWSGTIAVRLRGDNEVRQFSCWLQSVTENGQIASVTGWARDISKEREAEVRFAELFEGLREGILFSTPDGKLIDANPALVRILGYESKEELQRVGMRAVYENSADRDAFMRELAEKGAVHDREIVLRRKDGKRLDCLTSGFAIRDAAGRPVRLHGTVVDITERKEIERRLHQEQELRRRVVANFPDLIIVLDRNGQFTFVSDQAKQILGRTPEEYMGAQIGARANPEDRRRLQNMVQSILSGETSRAQVEFNAPHTDGSWRTLVATAGPLFDESGKITGVVTSARDVTEARKIEKQLHAEQEFARRLIECFPNLIVVLNREGRFTFVSDRVKDILGVAPEKYVGEMVGQRTDEESRTRLLAMFGDIISGRKRQEQIEIRARHANGTWRSLQINASPLYDQSGEIIGMVSAGQDITESKRIEQQLAQNEKLAAMGQMMVGAAHELNNPLTAILGVTDLLRERATDDAMRRQVDLVLKQARRAATIVQNLLAFSRPVTLGRSKLDVADLVREVLQVEKSALEQKNIRVTFQSPADLPQIEGDRKLLKEVFLNILANAEQAITAARDHGTITVRLSHAGEHLRASFSDDGVGIPAESIGKIFDPFFTTKRTGGSSGLGLTICLAVVKEHGGRIEIESTPNAGAAVHVLLPLSAESTAPTAPVGVTNKQGLSAVEGIEGRTAVIVDDEESIREVVQEGLATRGMKVEAFGSSEAALAHLAMNSCDVIVCDFNLPGLNGEQFLRRLKAQSAGPVPHFVFITGDLVDPGVARGYREMGASVLQKPFHVTALATMLAQILKPQPASVG